MNRKRMHVDDTTTFFYDEMMRYKLWEPFV